MKHESPQRTVLAAPDVDAPTLGQLAQSLGLRLGPPDTDTHSRTLLDTFDGLAYRAGLVLSFDARAHQLRVHSPLGERLHDLNARKMPAFAEDLPGGAAGRLIAGAIKVRRLIPKAEVAVTTTRLALLDDLDKTIAHIGLERGVATRLVGERREAPLMAALSVQPVLGYTRQCAPLLAALQGSPLSLAPLRSLHGNALAAVGLNPRGEAPGTAVRLCPERRSVDGVCDILEELRAVMVGNEEGLRAALDTEFLHDFRVAVRKTRSLMSRLRTVLPPASLEHFRSEFAWLGTLTGPTRDLDVYLIKLEGYQAALPVSEHASLNDLRHFLRRQQRREQQRVLDGLAEPRYQALQRDWSDYLSAGRAGEATPVGEAPLLDVARQSIWRQLRRVRKRGRAIDARTPAEALHQLRIECKKLRYLLEAFRGLFEKAGCSALISALKKLQDNLGDFNDYEVQAGSLRRFAHRMGVSSDIDPDTYLVMGRLVERLARAQDAEREAFHSRWRGFDTKEHEAFSRAAFAPQPAGARR